ncbi:MAG: hypothetical protein QXW97_01805 [Candidatus Pacearchaeota archaeon]
MNRKKIGTNRFIYFTNKEIVWIILMIIIFEFIITLDIDKNEKLIINLKNPFILLVPILIIFTSITVKKIASYYYDIRIEFETWKIYRWSYYSRSHFKKPFPIGIVFPFFITLFSLSYIKPLTFLQFNYKNYPERRIQKHRGRIRKSEINEYDPAFVIAWSGYALIGLSIIGILLNFKELARFPLYYVLWNLIPFGGLDGTKIFFGSLINWILLLIITLITLAISFIVFL